MVTVNLTSMIQLLYLAHSPLSIIFINDSLHRCPSWQNSGIIKLTVTGSQKSLFSVLGSPRGQRSFPNAKKKMIRIMQYSIAHLTRHDNQSIDVQIFFSNLYRVHRRLTKPRTKFEPSRGESRDGSPVERARRVGSMSDDRPPVASREDRVFFFFRFFFIFFICPFFSGKKKPRQAGALEKHEPLIRRASLKR